MQQITLKYKVLLIRLPALVASILFLLLLFPTGSDADLLSTNDAAQYKAAFKAAQAHQWQTAEKLADQAKDPLPAKALSWLRFSTTDSGAAFSAIDHFLRTNPDWPQQTMLRRQAELAMKEVLSDDAAIAWFKRNPPLTPTGAIRYAKALLAKGRKAEATAFVRRVWREFDMDRHEERNFRRAFHKLLRSEDHAARLDRLIWDQRVGSARRQMHRVGRDQQYLAQARLMLMRRVGGVDNAIARVPVKLQTDPGLIYERLRWRRRKGFSDGAIELLHDPPKELDHPAKWWAERGILARRALRDGNVTLAYRLARDHRQTGGAPFAEAEWLAGWIALRYLGDSEVARMHFTRLYNNVRYPISRARGAYWIARAIEADRNNAGENHLADAAAWYKTAAEYTTTFYGQLAADRLRAARNPVPPPEPKPTAAQVKAFEQLELVRVTRMLDALGQDDIVDRFVSRLSDSAKTPEEWTLVARLATDIGRSDLAIKVAKRAIKQGVVLTVDGYPKLELRRELPVEPALIHAVIRQESAFDATAVSGAGARGLMQLMPSTAKLMARQLRVRYSKSKLISDPLHNLSLGSAYLEHLRENYDGSLILTLAAYNAGPGNVQRWLRENGDPRNFSPLDAIDWIESIPLPETRNYVQRVLENLTVYGYRFDDSFLPEILIDAMIGSDTVYYP